MEKLVSQLLNNFIQILVAIWGIFSLLSFLYFLPVLVVSFWIEFKFLRKMLGIKNINVFWDTTLVVYAVIVGVRLLTYWLFNYLGELNSLPDFDNSVMGVIGELALVFFVVCVPSSLSGLLVVGAMSLEGKLTDWVKVMIGGALVFVGINLIWILPQAWIGYICTAGGGC